MKQVIYKYQVKDKVCIPVRAQILDFQLQANVPVFWALVNPDETEKTCYSFRVIGTGHEFYAENELPDYVYMKTVQDNFGFVWHIFMKEG